MSPITLRKIRRTELKKPFQKLLLGKDLIDGEKKALLEIALILNKAGDENAQNLGYRILVLYSNHYSDYRSLYDIALSKGYFPVTKAIENKTDLSQSIERTFISTLLSSLGETYKTDGIYLTSQQVTLNDYFNNNIDRGVCVIAPTSYGKTELFINFCATHKKETIAIIVPTKALLAQMKSRVLRAKRHDDKKRKIITHPEMYNRGESGFIAILTQERLLRMMENDRNLQFDYVFIDEAHNLLSGDQRNVLLAKVITLLRNRNDEIALNYLTPFLVDSNNLKTRYRESDFAEYKIVEHLKTEKYYVLDVRENGENTLKLYDQFLDEFMAVGIEVPPNEIHLLQSLSGSKNIVYLNSPPKLEKFAMELASTLEPIVNAELLDACEALSSFLHKDYGLIDCIRRGVIYHHGSVPDMVKLYIENLYSIIDGIKYVVTSSTLLEGVNIPAEKLFVFECKKGRSNLTASQFKNLVGRICRFKEIFDPEKGSLAMLEPEVYIVACKHMASNANIEKFLRDRVKVDKKIKDELENVLLDATPITKNNKDKMEEANIILENLEPGVTGKDISLAQTDLGRCCYQNNVYEINILEHEVQISEYLDDISDSNNRISDTEGLMEVIYRAFILYIPELEHRNLQRLSEANARRFYKIFIDWRIRNASFNEMVRNFLDYWDKREKAGDVLIYVDKWGDRLFPGYHLKYWTDISRKSGKEKVNLAIVRIKEEQDFLDNQIIKFVEVLNDMNLLEDDFYKRIKYGTTDEKKITMMKNGISSSLAALLLDEYSGFLIVDVDANTVDLSQKVVEAMKTRAENRLHIFEAGLHVSN